MLPGPLVFVDIDTQRDFIEPTGALPIAGASEIVENLARITRYARENGIPVLATACSHTMDDLELKYLPAHCLGGTCGQLRIEATAWPGGKVVSPDERFEGSLPPHLTLEKREFDIFSRADADEVVASFRQNEPTFVVYGVATDYCVKAATLGLLARGCKVAVVADAIRAIEPNAEAEVLVEFTRRGALLTLTDVVCE